jgi:hypothetical protein
MASSTQVRSGLNSLIQPHVSARLRNTLFNRMPLLYFLFGRDGQIQDAVGLGRPKVNGRGGFVVSGIETAKAKREEILGARVYEPIVQISAPAAADGKALGMYDTLPVRASWTTLPPSSYVTRPRVKWVEWSDPYKVPNKEIRTTRSTAANELNAWKAIVSMFQLETTSVLAVHEKRWNQLLWGTTGNGFPSNEDAMVWDAPHSIEQALHTTNTYCGVDRSVTANAYWKSNRVTAATVADFESIINYCNYDLSLSAKGDGIDLIMVGGALFKKAKLEAKQKGCQIIFSGGVPDYGQFGFKREIVKIDNTYICYDPELDTANYTTHLAALNLSTWTFAIHPDANFKVSEPFDQSKIEGGDDAQTGNIRTEIMLVCEVPSLNAYFTNVA